MQKPDREREKYSVPEAQKSDREGGGMAFLLGKRGLTNFFGRDEFFS
jgi:hypothetical protein